MTAYRLSAGAALSDAQAAQLLTRQAQGEALNWAPLRAGRGWVLAPLYTLTPAQLAQHRERVSRCAQVLDGLTVPAALTA
ncbi:hypothetical protein ACINK0_03000 [Deinococcus sp. VB343]|uniref:hypothetical protein n=1 Tax=Deinococcus sp. VB343 TaxID=3385567 RepID=UPI0039C98E5A